MYYDEKQEDNLFAGLSKYTLHSIYPKKSNTTVYYAD